MEEQAKADLQQAESIRIARWGQSSRGQEAEQRRKFSWIGFALTAIPIVALSVLSTAREPCFGSPPYWLWFVAAGIWAIAFITWIGYRRSGGKDMASGILAGIGVALLPLGTTRFVNLDRFCL